MVNGELKEVKGFDRGSMLIYPEETWRRRSMPLLRRRSNEFFRPYVGVLLVWWLFFIPVLIYSIVETDFLVIGLVAVILAWLLMLAIGLYIRKTMLEVPTPGLYELGLQTLGNEFYPYMELRDIEIVDREDRLVGIVLYYRHDDSTETLKLWQDTVAFLGEEAVNELKVRVHGPGSPE
jgi:hypothetical protein